MHEEKKWKILIEVAQECSGKCITKKVLDQLLVDLLIFVNKISVIFTIQVYQIILLKKVY